MKTSLLSVLAALAGLFRRPGSSVKSVPESTGDLTDLSAPLPLHPDQEEAIRPNVLFISFDDMNDWISPLNDNTRGKPVIETPNLQALAAEGTLFTNAHTPAPLCQPARASLMAGVYPRNGDMMISQFRHHGFTGITTITQHFRNNGYVALGGGKIYPPLDRPELHWDIHVPFERPSNQKRRGPALNGLDLPENDGFDWGAVALKYEEMSDVQIAEWAIEALQRTYDKPFFLGVGFHFPHLPWYLPLEYLERHPLESIVLPVAPDDDLDDIPIRGRNIAWATPRTWSNPRNLGYVHSDHHAVVQAGEWRRAVQAYSAACTFIDDLIGRILEALSRSGHGDNTIVVVFSDHGWHLGEKQHWRKMTLWEESTRVPLILRYPEGLPSGRVVKDAVSLVDVYPTLLELAGLPQPPHPLDGNSLTGIVGGDVAGERYALTALGRGSVAIRDARWRYIRYGSDGGSELYDHRNDPMEHTNILASPAGADRYASRIAHYNELIDAYHPVSTPSVHD